MPDVLLLTMPWSALQFPSIQLGTLKAVLGRADIETETLHLNLRFADYVLAATEALDEAERITLDDLLELSTTRLAGDWVFAVAPFRTESVDDDRRFLDKIRTKASAHEFAAVQRLRALVPRFLEDCCELVLAQTPRVVGFTTSFAQNTASLALAGLLKQRDETLQIVFGGANCDGPMGAALHARFPQIDVVVRGEAERIAPHLFAELIAGRSPPDLPGLCVRKGGTSVAVPPSGELVPMGEVPAPEYDEYFETLAGTRFDIELSTIVEIPYETSRGCWWGEKNHCTFCGLNGSVMRFRSKSADQAFDELVELARRYRSRRFRNVDNIIELAHVRDLLPRLGKTGWDWELFYETKANLKLHELVAFAAAGVRRIQPGIESLSTPILRLMKKGVTALQNVRLLKWCRDLGIEVSWNLIYGFPHEAPEEYAAMARLIPRLVHLAPPSASALALERFSPYFERPAEYGLEVLGPQQELSLIYGAPTEVLSELTYTFEYRHVDGRDPASYVGPTLAAIDGWRESASTSTLVAYHGPDYITIEDRRIRTAPTSYTFGSAQAAIYRACAAGATARQILDTVRDPSVTDADVGEFLAELVELGLVFEERGRFLSLANERRTRSVEAVIDAADEHPAESLVRLGGARKSS